MMVFTMQVIHLIFISCQFHCHLNHCTLCFIENYSHSCPGKQTKCCDSLNNHSRQRSIVEEHQSMTKGATAWQPSTASKERSKFSLS